MHKTRKKREKEQKINKQINKQIYQKKKKKKKSSQKDRQTNITFFPYTISTNKGCFFHSQFFPFSFPSKAGETYQTKDNRRGNEGRVRGMRERIWETRYGLGRENGVKKGIEKERGEREECEGKEGKRGEREREKRGKRIEKMGKKGKKSGK